MNVIANVEVTDLVRSRGGRLYVWTHLRRCCSGGITFLDTATSPPGGRRFRRFGASGFDLWLDAGRSELPAQLYLEVRGRRKKRVEAFWNDRVFVV